MNRKKIKCEDIKKHGTWALRTQKCCLKVKTGNGCVTITEIGERDNSELSVVLDWMIETIREIKGKK